MYKYITGVSVKSIKLSRHFSGLLLFVTIHGCYPARCFYALANENPEAAGAIWGRMHENPEVCQRDMKQDASYLCTAKRVAENGVNSNTIQPSGFIATKACTQTE